MRKAKKSIALLLAILSALCVASCATLHEPTPYIVRNASGGLIHPSDGSKNIAFKAAEKYVCFEPRDLARYMESVQRLLERLQAKQ